MTAPTPPKPPQGPKVATPTPTRPAGTITPPAAPPPGLVSGMVGKRLVGGLKLCLWGPNLCGKTRAALTFPRPIVIQWDPDASTVYGHVLPDGGTVPVLTPSLTQLKTMILPALRTKTLGRLLIGTPWEGYEPRTVIFDSWTYFSEVLKTYHLANAPVTKSGAKDTQGAWGLILSDHVEVAKALVASTVPSPTGVYYHYVATIHEKEVLNDDGSLKEIAASVPGQFAKLFFGQFAVVLQLTLENSPSGPRYYARTRPDNARKTMGDRLGGNGKFTRLPPEMTSVTYAGLLAAWGVEDGDAGAPAMGVTEVEGT